MKKKTTSYFIIGTFVTLYLLVSVISTIHVIDFFKLSNPTWLAISLAIAFEVGAAASLASIITLDKMNKGIVWSLFIILTFMQAMGNTYYAYTNLANFQGWIELFGLAEEELIYQKRVLSVVSGAVLPIIALGFIKSLVDYIKPSDEIVNVDVTETPVVEITEDITEEIVEDDDYFDGLYNIGTSIADINQVTSNDDSIKINNVKSTIPLETRKSHVNREEIEGYIDGTQTIDAGKSDIRFDEETEADTIPMGEVLKSRSDTAYQDPTKL